MRTKTELYREAKRRVESRRQRAVTEAVARRAAALAAIPGLEAAEQQVRLLGLKAVQLAAQGAGEGAVADAQATRALAQAELDRLLAAHGYGPGSLEPKFTCPLCQDTGLAKGRLCECVGRAARELRREEINAESPLALCTFETMQLRYYPNRQDPDTGVNIRAYMGETLSALGEYADTFDLKSANLLITGNAGLGKTHASLSIVDRVLKKQWDAIYISAQNLFSQLERERFSDNCSLLEAVREADLLVLDDLGTEHVNPYMLSCFYDILNTRMLERRPTIYTSNIVDGQKFEARYTEKIASRLAGSCEPVLFLGDDIRPLLHP